MGGEDGGEGEGGEDGEGEEGRVGVRRGSAAGAAPASLLEPDKFAPLVIPFVGGPGPLCGGAALPDGSRLAADAGALLGLAPAVAAHAAAHGPSRQPSGGGFGGGKKPQPIICTAAAGRGRDCRRAPALKACSRPAEDLKPGSADRDGMYCPCRKL